MMYDMLTIPFETSGFSLLSLANISLNNTIDVYHMNTIKQYMRM